MSQKGLSWALIIVAVVIALLCACLGTMMGGLVGYWAGQRASLWSTPGTFGWQELPEPEPIATLPQPERVPTLPESETTPTWRMGALITQVIQDSPADAAGMQVGDILVSVDARAIDQQNTLAQLIGKHEPGDVVAIRLVRGARLRTVQVTLGAKPDNPDVGYMGIFYRLVTAPTAPIN